MFSRAIRQPLSWRVLWISRADICLLASRDASSSAVSESNESINCCIRHGLLSIGFNAFRRSSRSFIISFRDFSRTNEKAAGPQWLLLLLVPFLYWLSIGHRMKWLVLCVVLLWCCKSTPSALGRLGLIYALRLNVGGRSYGRTTGRVALLYATNK